MYKARLKEWGFRKYLKSSEIQKARHKAHSGQVARLPVVHGRQLGSKRLKSFVHRVKPKSENGDEAETQIIKFESPSRSPSPLAGIIIAPESLRLAESSLHAVFTYSHGRFDDKSWNLVDHDFDKDLTRHWWHEMALAADKIEEQRDLSANFRILNRCCANYRTILHRQDPLLVWVTYMGILKLGQIGEDIAMSFAKFVTNLSTIEFGASHPFTLLWTNLQAMGLTNARQAALPIVGAQFDTFKEHAEPGNLFWVVSTSLMIRHLQAVNLLTVTAAQQMVQVVIKELRDNPGPDRLQSEYWTNWTRMLMCVILHNSDLSDRYAESDKLLCEVEEWHRSGGVLYNNGGLQIECAGLRARVEEEFGRHKEAVHWHKRIIELCLERKPRGHRRTLRAYTDLEQYHRRRGDLEAAEITRQAYHDELNWLVRDVTDEDKM